MTVEDVLYGLCVTDFQRVVVKSFSRKYGLIPLAGGYRDSVIKHVGERQVCGCDFRYGSLHLKVMFQESDVI